MTIIALKSFAGISPRTPPRFLQDAQAQEAVDCDVFTGSLKPRSAAGAAVVALANVGVVNTIYRYGQDVAPTTDTSFWFSWANDVDVCRGQISGDTSEWTYFTEPGVGPQATYAAIATGAGIQPLVTRPMGLAAPTAACTLGVVGAADATAVAVSRVYTFTYVNKEAGFEIESAPAPASVTVSVTATTQTVDVTTPVAAPIGYLATHKRIYRTVSGEYLLVAEVALATATYNDAVLPADIGVVTMPSLYWAEPPAGLTGLVNLPNGGMAGFVGRDIYFCDPYHPYAWPVSYIQSVDYPIVALGVTDTSLIAMTTGSPYFLQGSHPSNVTIVRTGIEQACVSKRSVVSMNGAVIYASPDGLVSISPSGSKILTESLFTYAQWQALIGPTTIHAYSHNMKYVAFTATGGFVYDFITGQFITHNIVATAGYSDLQRDKLFLCTATNNVVVWEAGAALALAWKSKKFTLPRIEGFSCAQVEAEAYPVTLQVYAGSTLIHTQVATDRTPFRLPAIQARDWELRITGSTEVFAVVMAQSMEEIAGA